MLQNNLKLIVGLIVGFITAFFLARGILREPQTAIETDGKTVEVKLVTKIDTVYIPQNHYFRDTVKITQVRVDSVFKSGTKELVMIPAIKRIYADSVKVSDSAYVGYKANVTGTLDKMDISYSNRKSIIVIHRTDSVLTNTTITKTPRGLYVGLDAGLRELSPKLEYVNNKNIYGVKYNIVGNQVTPMPNVSISYSRKLW